MSVSETDLELLETYLDDELSAEEGDTLRRRLASEPVLATAMDQVRQDRALRQQAFGTMEPADRETVAATDVIVRSLRQAATREKVWSERRRLIRQFSAAAACLVVGLLVGWFGHGRPDVPVAPVETNTVASRDTGTPGSVNFPPRNGNTALVSNDRTGGFNVQITDDGGRVLAVQHFNTLNEARAFSNDLARWQTRQRQMRSGDIRLIGDDF